jgi:hypothetical protein
MPATARQRDVRAEPTSIERQRQGGQRNRERSVQLEQRLGDRVRTQYHETMRPALATAELQVEAFEGDLQSVHQSGQAIARYGAEEMQRHVQPLRTHQRRRGGPDARVAPGEERASRDRAGPQGEKQACGCALHARLRERLSGRTATES